MKVDWSDAAIAQLQSIHDYIAQNSEFYAKRTVDRITNRTKQIALFPYSGRKVAEFDSETIREVLEGQYRIIYEITRDQTPSHRSCTPRSILDGSKLPQLPDPCLPRSWVDCPHPPVLPQRLACRSAATSS